MYVVSCLYPSKDTDKRPKERKMSMTASGVLCKLNPASCVWEKVHVSFCKQ